MTNRSLRRNSLRKVAAAIAGNASHDAKATATIAMADRRANVNHESRAKVLRTLDANPAPARLIRTAQHHLHQNRSRRPSVFVLVARTATQHLLHFQLNRSR
jgi:hypothetical protein